MEVNVLDAINKITLSKIALRQAADYSVNQASYLLSSQGGYYDLTKIDSYNCIPYWKIYDFDNLPDYKKNLKKVQLYFFKKYTEQFEGEVQFPEYEKIEFQRTAEQKIIFGSNDKITLKREMVEISEPSSISISGDIKTERLFEVGKNEFISSTELYDRVKNSKTYSEASQKIKDFENELNNGKGSFPGYLSENIEVRLTPENIFWSGSSSPLKGLTGSISVDSTDPSDVKIKCEATEPALDCIGAYVDTIAKGCPFESWEGNYAVFGCGSFPVGKNHDAYCFVFKPECSGSASVPFQVGKSVQYTPGSTIEYSIRVLVEITDKSQDHFVYDYGTRKNELKKDELKFYLLFGNKEIEPQKNYCPRKEDVDIIPTTPSQNRCYCVLSSCGGSCWWGTTGPFLCPDSACPSTTTTTVPSRGIGDLISCPSNVAMYMNSYNQHRALIQEATRMYGLTNYFSDQEALDFVAGIITTESNWNQWTGCTENGGCGIMQITKPTADGGCPEFGGFEGIKTSLEANIRCGVKILTGKIGYMDRLNKYDSQNLLKIGAAAYNGGQGTIQKAIQLAGDSKWENINNLGIMTEACKLVGYANPSAKAEIILRYVDQKVYPYYQSWSSCQRQTLQTCLPSQFNIPPLAQRDPAWGYGKEQDNWCGITAAAMLFSYASGTSITPKDVYEYCCGPECGSCYAWSTCAAKEFTGSNMKASILPKTEKEYIEGLRSFVCDKKKPVIAHVSIYGGIDHFVLVTGVTSNSVFFNDPWYGTQRELSHSEFFDLAKSPKSASYRVLYLP